MNNPTKPRVVILEQERMLDTFFKVDKITVSYKRFDGTMSPPSPRLVLNRGDAVAALLFDPEQRKVIAVRQFRLPTYGKSTGWLVEAIAGMIDADETPEEALIREVSEETGYRIEHPQRICTFFPSPGGCSERIFLYYAEVSGADKLAAHQEADENIALVEFDLPEFFDKLEAGEFEDSKLNMAGYWLMATQRSVPR